MSYYIKTIFICLFFLFINQQVIAHIIAPLPVSIWSSKLKLGADLHSGNRKLYQFNSKLDLDYLKQKWENGFFVDYQYGYANDQTIASKMIFDMDIKYLFSSKGYFFTNVNIEHNRFGPYEIVARESMGYGHTIYDSGHTKFRMELGPAIIHSKENGRLCYESKRS